MPINKKSLIAMLKSFNSTLWAEREIDGIGEKHNFLPIFKYTSPISGLEHSYGILDSGIWLPEYSDSVRVMQEGNYWGFFVLLETPFRDVVSLLNENVKRIGLPEVAITTFPFDQLIEFSISKGSHWGLLAEEWINSGYPLNDNISKLLPNNKLVIRRKNERINKIFSVTKK
ncbi:MAG: hypothetical protein GY714_05160 [Desulfobacterales bacterium]|nr:hypothetical protein [Desulfobacterales bacterium]